MRLAIKVLVIGTISLVLLFSAVYFLFVFYGKGMITAALGNITHKKVSIGSFGITPPLNIHIRNLNIDGLGKVDAVFISPSITGFFLGRVTLNDLSLVRPEVTYEHLAAGTPLPVVSGGATPAVTASKAAASPAVPDLRIISLPLVLKHAVIKDGKVDFFDRATGGDGIKLTVKDINLNLTDLYLIRRPAVTRFDLKSKIPWQQGQDEGTLEAEGWLDLSKKNMQVNVNLNGIDGVYLYPYYSQWVDLEKARIEKARLNFRSNIHGANNDITADCHLELVDIVFKQRASEESQEKAERIASAVLDVFRAMNQGKIVLDFTIRTKMDRPEFGIRNIKTAVEDKLTRGRRPSNLLINVLLLPTNLLQGTVRGTTDLTKAVVDGTFGVGKELKKAVEDTFRK